MALLDMYMTSSKLKNADRLHPFFRQSRFNGNIDCAARDARWPNDPVNVHRRISCGQSHELRV
jgi:hypothetical protein